MKMPESTYVTGRRVVLERKTITLLLVMGRVVRVLYQTGHTRIVRKLPHD